MTDQVLELVVVRGHRQELAMTLLIVVALLLALDLAAWRWATTPATAAT